MIDYVKAKRHYIMAIAIMFVVVSLSDTTYSLFLKADSTDNFNYNTGLLDLQFIEDEQITLQNAFPLIDSEGLKTSPYKLTVKNTGSLPYLFDLKMLSSTDENVIGTKYIKVQVNDSNSNTLYSTNNIIASNIILYPNEEKTFNVKIWLDANTPNAELGKTFIAKIATNGQAVYKTLDTSGANHPELIDEMIPIYYDEPTKSWKKADSSNTNELFEWYNYDNQKWANVVTINSSNRQIYDITRNNNLKITEAKTNNGNYITDEKYLDIGLSQYGYHNISSVFRLKFNDLSSDKIYIMSNGQISYYYDVLSSKFIFKVGNTIVSSDVFNIEKDKWYVLGYTYDTTKVSFYINGTKLSTNNIYGPIKSNNTFKVGTNDTFEELSNIEIGDIYIYKDILTPGEISSNYKTVINIIYDNLLSGYNDFKPKTLKEYYLSKEYGTTINNEDVSSFYVWIPRFKYKLWNVTGTPGVDSYNARNQGIDIVFEYQKETSGTVKCANNTCYTDDLLITKVTDADNGKYYTHPAFTSAEGEMNGLWVSKYEISTEDEKCKHQDQDGCLYNNLTIKSKPGNVSWRNNYLSYFYQNIKEIDPNNNYRLIKNTEWGAITYMAHSKYGICQDNKCNSIGVNNTYISGYELMDSTTSNNYGVFDMAGSATEFVMANYSNQNNKLSLNETYFETLTINDNDYDLYFNNTFILGDATREISLQNASWDSNTATFINDTNNWFIRGGIGTTNNSGIFYYNATTNTNSEYITTRIVIR